jgi:hypothetical protein
MANRKAGPVAAFIIGSVFLLIGGGVAFYFGKPILDKAKASESWPTVQGQVIKSELESHHDKKKTTYSALVIYKFEADGEDYEGDEVWFGQYSSSDRSAMQKLVKEYPVGKDVTVYYSPDDPTQAVLQPGAFTSSYMVYGIGLLFFGIGCLLVIIPLLKLVFLTAAVVTSPADSFVGGGSASGADTFGDAGFDNHNDDDDGFGGIPGS